MFFDFFHFISDLKEQFKSQSVKYFRTYFDPGKYYIRDPRAQD